MGLGTPPLALMLGADGSAPLNVAVAAVTPNGFSILATSAPSGSTTYTVRYIVQM